MNGLFSGYKAKFVPLGRRFRTAAVSLAYRKPTAWEAHGFRSRAAQVPQRHPVEPLFPRCLEWATRCRRQTIGFRRSKPEAYRGGPEPRGSISL